MNELQGYNGQIDRTVEVITETARVWVIARGEYEDRSPIAAVQGTESDALRYVEQYNATHSWSSEEDKAHVWCDVEFVAPLIQG